MTLSVSLCSCPPSAVRPVLENDRELVCGTRATWNGVFEEFHVIANPVSRYGRRTAPSEIQERVRRPLAFVVGHLPEKNTVSGNSGVTLNRKKPHGTKRWGKR